MPSPDQDNVLTVLTLNIWGDHLWEERKHALVDWFTQIRPDVVALQEVTRSPELCEATWLAEQTGMDALGWPMAPADEPPVTEPDAPPSAPEPSAAVEPATGSTTPARRRNVRLILSLLVGVVVRSDPWPVAAAAPPARLRSRASR